MPEPASIVTENLFDFEKEKPLIRTVLKNTCSENFRKFLRKRVR